MRISVRSRCSRGAKEPRSFCLGEARLRVIAIDERRDSAEIDYFEVRVLDGRRFVLCYQRRTDAWELAAVYARGARRRARAPVQITEVRRRRGRFFARCEKALAAFAHAWKSEPITA